MSLALPSTRKEILKDWLIVPLIGGIVIGLAFNFYSLLNGELAPFFEDVVSSYMFWTTLSNGNAWIVCQIDKYYSWLEHPLRRTIIGVVLMFAYTVVASWIILYFFIEFYLGYGFLKVMDRDGWFVHLVIPLSITTFMVLWFHGKGFLEAWRQAAIDVERLKTENMKSKFESLRSQVNPHFLFNSLNALSSLVYSSADDANKFIQKLSEVYRYVLDHQHDEVVEVKREIEFLKSFVYLNQIRFGTNFIVEYRQLDLLQAQQTLPPVALQLLMENAIKHNEISIENPLRVTVSVEADFIIVENNRNPITTSKRDSSGLGLNNIRARYELLTNQKVLVESDETFFRVKLPLLQLQS